MAKRRKRWGQYDAQARGLFVGFFLALGLLFTVWRDVAGDAAMLRFVAVCVGTAAAFRIANICWHWGRRRMPGYDPLADLRPR